MGHSGTPDHHGRVLTETGVRHRTTKLERKPPSRGGLILQVTPGISPSLPDDLAVCIASIEVLKRNMLSEDGTTELVWKIKLWNKAHALELLGKYHGLGDTPLDARPQVPAFTLPPGSRGVSVH